MLLLGGLARNTINEVVGELDPEWSLNIRRIALTTILLRAGLGLDLKKLRQNSSALIRLTALP